MNIYLKTELEKVTQEQKRLLIKAHNSSLTETVLANDHNPVLKEDFEKYNALLRMREILDKHFLNIKSRNEYLELSKIAGHWSTERTEIQQFPLFAFWYYLIDVRRNHHENSSI